jgi:hypothetical protein
MQSGDLNSDDSIDSDDTSQLTPFIETNYFGFTYGDTEAGDRVIDAQYWSDNAYVDYVFGSQS